MKRLFKGVFYIWSMLATVILALGFVIFTTNGLDKVQSRLAELSKTSQEIKLLANNANNKPTLDTKISDVLKLNKDRVVYIEIGINPEYQERAKQNGISTGGSGSGWFVEVNEDFAYVATNHHVIEAHLKNPEVFNITVYELYSPWEYSATVVGYDTISDMAVLKVDRVLGNERWNVIPWANHADTVEGDTVVAIGHGMSLPWSMTSGTITALDRWQIRPYNLMIQTDTVVNPGNSGGPLMNLNGEVIGVVDALLDPGRTQQNAAYAGVSLAIAGFQAEKSVREIIEKGKVDYPYINFSIGNPNRQEYTEAFFDDLDGSYVIITELGEQSNAYEAGFREGDFIMSVNGRKMLGMVSMIRVLLEHQPGDVVTIELWRNRELITLDYILEDLSDFNQGK